MESSWFDTGRVRSNAEERTIEVYYANNEAQQFNKTSDANETRSTYGVASRTKLESTSVTLELFIASQNQVRGREHFGLQRM